MRTLCLCAFLLLVAITSCGFFDPIPNPPVEEDSFFAVPLSGMNEVPEGDADGIGMAHILISADKKEMCWEISFANIDNPNAAHIHAGAKGLNGPVILAFEPFPKGCSDVEPETMETIMKNPENYYVNIHNAEFPDGAIRGQMKE